MYKTTTGDSSGATTTPTNSSSSRKDSSSINRESKKFEKATKQIKIRESTYYELLSVGTTLESLDSIIRRALKIAKPVLKETQAKLYKDMASYGVTS